MNAEKTDKRGVNATKVEAKVSLFDIALSLSKIVDMISHLLANHHIKVASISVQMARNLALPEDRTADLCLAALLHDIGGLTRKERLETLDFEVSAPHMHAKAGYLLIRDIKPLSAAADIIRFHHVPWNDGRGDEWGGNPVPYESHILHVADRASTLLVTGQEERGIKGISEQIRNGAGVMFPAELTDVFEETTANWRSHGEIEEVFSEIAHDIREHVLTLGLSDLFEMGVMLCHLIDFRSHFTAYHSNGVAANADEIARISGFSEEDCRSIKIAGFLHDIGKLAIPVELLEKPGSLEKSEYEIIKKHPLYTYSALKPMVALDEINMLASCHHERLDGTGYPFGRKGKELPAGARILAVADIFTALTEDRPYRPGLPPEEAVVILKNLAEKKKIDGDIVSILVKNVEDIYTNHLTAIEATLAAFEEFKENL